MESKTSVVIVAHGSSVDGAQEGMLDVADAVREVTGYRTAVGYLVGEPKAEAVVGECIAQGAERILLMPYFLSAGIHVRRDILAIATGFAEKHPNVHFLVGKPLGGHPLLRNVVVDRVREIESTNQRTNVIVRQTFS